MQVPPWVSRRVRSSQFYLSLSSWREDGKENPGGLVSDAVQEWVEDDDSPEALLELLEERGWGDGLPVVAPTAERVDRMMQMLDADPDEAVALLPPRNGAASGRAIAVNAVLAGCPPEVM